MLMGGTVGTSIALAACSSPSTSTPPANATAPTASGAATSSTTSTSPTTVAVANTNGNTKWPLPTGNVTISIWHGTDQTMMDLYSTELIPNYQKLHPNVTVQDSAVADVDNKLLVAVASGTAPDIFHTNSVNLQNYMEKGVLDPMPPQAWGYDTVDDLVQKAFLPGSTVGMSYQGKIYGAATQYNAQDLFINTKMFADAGLDPVRDAPKTWEDVARINEQITKKDSSGRYLQKGFDWSMTTDQAFSAPLQLLIFQAGGQVLNDDGTPAFNSDAGVTAMKVLKNVAVDPRTSSATQKSPMQDFADQQIAMKLTAANTGPFIEAINPSMSGNYSVQLQPQIDPGKPVSTVTFFAMVVNARSSPNARQVAWDFEHWVLTQPALWLKTTGQLQNQADWYKTDEAHQIMPYIDVAFQDMAYGRPAAITTHGAELGVALSKAGERYLFQNMDPKESLDQAADEFRRALSS